MKWEDAFIQSVRAYYGMEGPGSQYEFYGTEENPYDMSYFDSLEESIIPPSEESTKKTSKKATK